MVTVNVPAGAAGGPSARAGDRGYVSITEAAAYLGVSRVSVWRWIREGRLLAVRLGHRTARIHWDELDRALRRIGGGGAPARAAGGASGGASADPAMQLVTAALSVGPADIRDGEHLVQFYETDDCLLAAIGEYAGTSLERGDVAVVIATSDHRAGVEDRLRGRGLNLAAAAATGRYVALDAAETLACLLVDGRPDAARFGDVIGGLIARSAATGRRVRAYGEMVALLVADGNPRGALLLETLWNELQARQPFALFCGYPMDRLGGEPLAEFIGEVCKVHSRVVPGESYTALADAEARLREIAALQQKARSLQAEIAERNRVAEELRAALEERNRLLGAEQAARAAAEAALRARDDFISVAAHELKTPLTSLSGHAQLLRRRLARTGSATPEQIAQALTVVTDQSAKLTRLIGQLLDVSRLQGGTLTLEPRPTDLVRLAEQAVAAARAWSDRHTVTLAAPAALPAIVDPLRLEQVLTNLLDNAVKYSPDGGSIAVALAQHAPGTAQLSVRDHGMGIPSRHRGHVFERFYQAHANGHRSGMGLGLHISRQIVEQHGGAIAAEFPADGGTRFVVTLPVQAAQAAHVGQAAQA